jgi:membrane associated rhomboid family serine protease
MDAMEQRPAIPPPPTEDRCYRHPGVATGVHCTRCGRPICTDCMVPAPVGHQCPNCVAEARREFRRGPGRRIAVANAKGASITKLLLLAIGAMYVVEVAVGGPGSLLTGPSEAQLVRLGASVPLVQRANGALLGIAAGQYWRLFTSMFLHAGILHIAFNAYALWLFGQMVEREFGHTRMLVIYLVSGFLASVASYAFGPVGTVGVGASGAIFGIFGAFIAFNYRRRHLAQAAANLRWAMTLILLNAFLAFAFRGIDWRAHVGGFVAGLILVQFMRPPRRTTVLGLET